MVDRAAPSDAVADVPTSVPGGRRYGRARDGRLASRISSPARATLVVLAVGMLITVSLTLMAWTLNRHNEHRLLEVQTRQAGAVIASTILSISGPLATALEIETSTGGNVEEFSTFMSSYVRPGGLFVSASLWESEGSSLRPVASVGVPPGLDPASVQAQAFVRSALHRTTFVVTSIRLGGQERIGYADANPGTPEFVVYAERAIPANRQVPVESDSAFSDLDYATYLGTAPRLADLETTDVSPTELPLSGDTARAAIPFGDTTLTLVAGPRGQLGGGLGADLQWIFLAGGALVTIATAFAARQLVKRRRDAELDAQTITGLFDQLNALYGEQRTIAEALQRTLLPQQHPSVPNLEVASLYVAGADGVDIGGDWYSLIAVDERHFGFAVGDVSGRGIGAASIMARLRFTIRAYLLEGHQPDVVLEMCSHQLDIIADGHFATVLVGLGDLESRQITMANAGHLNPIIVSGPHAEYVTTDLGMPLGIGPCAYASRTVALPAGSTFLAFTDGLVERRGESIDVGLNRLSRAATAAKPALQDYVAGLVADLAHTGSRDDVAILAFKWREPVEVLLGEPDGDRDSMTPLAGIG
jgi:serine phosphatase RsbU (regulator of sigma subunit)